MTLGEYLGHSRRLIRKFAPFWARGVFLDDDEVVGRIASAMMEADWRYDEAKGRSCISHRLNRGRIEIKRILRESNRPRPQSLSDLSDDSELASTAREPWEDLADDEDYRRRWGMVRSWMGKLSSERRAAFALRHGCGMTNVEIARFLGISRQAAGKSADMAFEELRGIAHWQEISP
jgi:DNA-directed RNA polymerase specialized sigma subunit